MTDQVASAGPEEAPASAPAGAEITVARAEPVWFEPVVVVNLSRVRLFAPRSG